MIFELLREYIIQIDYNFALCSRNIAIEIIYRDYDKLFAQLPAFLHTLQLRNPRTLYEFQTTSDDRFKYIFLALRPCISAFQKSSRPVVMIDGTHLKGKNKRLPISIGQTYSRYVSIGIGEHARIPELELIWDHVLTQEAINKLSKNVEYRRCFAICCTSLAHLWKIKVCRETYMVDLQHLTCDCHEFELDLIPCNHVVATIRYSGGHIYDFVDRCYKMKTLVNMYDSVIMGLPRSEDWILPPYGSPPVLAPLIKKQVGRPQMLRAWGGVEASSSS
ncbi:hypothetical protein C2S51_020103 [Perilla frutescens var. frutescens]|nr:hypothetical protein C2S51_020103 [Perilla frutescens var. frutescens]